MTSTNAAPDALSLAPGASRARASGGTARRNWRRTFAGYALAWPWFDGFSAWSLRRLYFPASRLWAAAQLAGGSADRFHQAAQLPRRLEHDRRLESALARFEKARAHVVAVEAEWERAFFGPEDTPLPYRNAIEAARLDARHAYNSMRRLFAFMLLREVAPVRLQTPSPDEFADCFGAGGANLARLSAPPDPMPAIEISRTVHGPVGMDYWLKFRSPLQRLGDTVYARVHEPVGVADPPTLILGHGICVEFDHWHGMIDEADNLCAAGFRVVRPEFPWHGRRAPRGTFGGERLVATFPTGLLDTFAGALAEWSVLADWARRTSRGPLAFGGTSLGAQVAQLAAHRAQSGPEHLRPDGLFLVTHCGGMAGAALHGDMARIFGGTREAQEKGWTPELIARCLACLDPGRAAPVAPERIVTVLGRRDRVTPFASALHLIDAWNVPAENRFIADRGHFSMPMTLVRDLRPVERFREVMGRSATI